jgi:hypothetical protein
MLFPILTPLLTRILESFFNGNIVIPPTPSELTYLLQEDGFFFLQEDGFKIILTEI